MTKWIKGSTPSENGWYWVTVKRETYNRPVEYRDGWITNQPLDVEAFMSIPKPAPHCTIGDGTGYYIRTEDNLLGTYYFGWGLNPAKEGYRGYSTIESAMRALERYRKRKKEKYPGLAVGYSIVRGDDGSIVWEG